MNPKQIAKSYARAGETPAQQAARCKADEIAGAGRQKAMKKGKFGQMVFRGVRSDKSRPEVESGEITEADIIDSPQPDDEIDPFAR
jgi:hypothetical protein